MREYAKFLVWIILVFAYSRILIFGEEAMAETKAAIFAGGCFWCLEPPFDNKEGVQKTTVGYTGGSAKTANYEAVGRGDTGHREAIEVTYDAEKVSYSQLLDVFFENIDPLDTYGQYADRGFQYTTAVYYQNEKEKAANEAAIAAWSKKLGQAVVTINEPATSFYPAEEYHQEYYKKNPLRYNAYKYGSGRGKK
jgi:peptide-methionine (S)-S-oxide reductase